MRVSFAQNIQSYQSDDEISFVAEETDDDKRNWPSQEEQKEAMMEYCKSNLCSSGPISPVRFTIDNCTGGKRRHSGDGILVSMVQRRFSVPLVEHTSADGLTSAQVKSIQKLRLRQLKMDAFALNILLITFIVTLVLWFPNIVVLCLPFDM